MPNETDLGGAALNGAESPLEQPKAEVTALPTPEAPRSIAPGEVDHTKSKDYLYALGANARVDAGLARDRDTEERLGRVYDYGDARATQLADEAMRYPTESLRNEGFDVMLEQLKERYKNDPNGLRLRQRLLVRANLFFDEHPDIAAAIQAVLDRPTPEEKRSYRDYYDRSRLEPQ